MPSSSRFAGAAMFAFLVAALGLASSTPTLAQLPTTFPYVEPAKATGDPSTIKLAPAFTPKELTALPTDSWPTNGGNIFNQRYSPATEINTSNVANMKAIWRTGMLSGMRQDHSGQTQILAYGDTLYVSNGANDVFAMDIESGKILWTFSGKPDPRAGSALGHSNRGVALGDGKVFLGTLDSRLIAIDQKTGKEAWTATVANFLDGYGNTSAPLYYDGLVIMGMNGGEGGARGRVNAFNAKTGAKVWTFFTVPGPGEVGHDTWPANTDAWEHGGATVWQTPAVDPELGLIYFSTGNPGPDVHGSVRAGDNLFSVSILAIEARTGKYRWHFQEIHHDIWDYDAPNQVVLFDAPYKGKMRKGIAQVGKTGFTYLLDRATGKPLIGIVEKPVPQEPRLSTAKTQPYPIGDPVVPQQVDIVPEGARLEPGTTHLPNYGRIFTPFWTDEVVVKPSTNGGANWPPSSYDPTTNILYVCATDRAATYRADATIAPYVAGRGYNGGRWGQTSYPGGGMFTAVDLKTNRIAWQQQWREICFSGSVVTAGGVVFTGRADGRLTALDKTNGNKLWEFMTDAGVNTTVTTFMHNGKQRVVVHAGGGTFANGKRGDGIWMFGLDGTMPTLAPQRPAFGGPGGGGAPAAAPAAAPRPVAAR